MPLPLTRSRARDLSPHAGRGESNIVPRRGGRATIAPMSTATRGTQARDGLATARKRKAGEDRHVSGDAPDAELFDRLVASAAGLPRVCVLKRCRRRKRCLGAFAGDEPPCVSHHRGLARARFQSALKVLGWPNRKAAT
jgi:hypothetical protein